MSRSGKRHLVIACGLLLALAVDGCSTAPSRGDDGGSAATASEPPARNPSANEFGRLADQWTNGRARLLVGHQPDHYLADFNGDGNRDAAVPIEFEARGAPRELGDVTVLNPWLASVEPGAKDPHETSSDKALLVLHGASKEWSAVKPSAAFLLLDSVFDDLRVVDRQAAGRNLKVPALAKGDCLLTGTEEAKGLICWDGQTYRWTQRGD
jgi:hypothetical protein